MEEINMKKTLSIITTIILMTTLCCITVSAEAPDIPDTPQGPNWGDKGVLYTFTLNHTQGIASDLIEYQVDWGDDTDTGWIGPFDEEEPIFLQKKWDTTGDFEVTVKARNIDTFEESDWSEPHLIHIDTLEIRSISGGMGVSAVIENVGDTSKDVDWAISAIGGTFPILHVNTESSGSIEPLTAGTSEMISLPTFLGLGRFKINIVLECAGEPVIEETVDATVLFFYVLIR